MKKIWISAILFAGLSLNYGCSENDKKQGETVEVAEQKNDSILDAKDAPDSMEDAAKFVVEAANGGMMEVETGKLAHDRAMDKDVKMFAHHMVEDHGKASAELKSLASQKNIVLPESVDAECKDKISKLKEKKGKDFDKEYMSMMVDDHKKTISKFEDASKDLKDAELKTWVDKTLPTLRMHRAMAEKTDSLLQAKDDKKGSGGKKDLNLK